MHIAMVAADFPPDVVGGAELQCLALSRALVRRGVKVTVFTSTRGVSRTDVIDDVEIRRQRTASSPQIGGRRPLSSIRWGLALGRWVRTSRPPVSVVHAHRAKMN